MTDWTTCLVVRDRENTLWGRDPWTTDDPHQRRWIAVGSAGLGADGCYEDEIERRFGPITPVLDADGLPVVRTVGDLTPRHIGRQVRIVDTFDVSHTDRQEHLHSDWGWCSLAAGNRGFCPGGIVDSYLDHSDKRVGGWSTVIHPTWGALLVPPDHAAASVPEPGPGRDRPAETIVSEAH